MTEPDTTRRRFLLGAGSAVSLALAGCSSSAESDGGGSGGTDTATPNSTPTTEHPETTHEDGDSHHEETTETHEEGDGHHDESTETHEEGDDHHDEPTETHEEGDGHHDESTETHEEGDDDHDETTVHEADDEHGGHGHGDPVGDPVDHAEVAMVTGDHGVHFEPHIVRVVPGGTVTFVNKSGSHSAAAYHPDNGKQRRVPAGESGWDSGLLTEEGATFQVTLETPGVYDVYCAPHETQGMIGSIIVGEPDPHDQPGLSAPAEDMPSSVQEKIADLNESANKALGHTH